MRYSHTLSLPAAELLRFIPAPRAMGFSGPRAQTVTSDSSDAMGLVPAAGLWQLPAVVLRL